jgi:hypothetical protein
VVSPDDPFRAGDGLRRNRALADSSSARRNDYHRGGATHPHPPTTAILPTAAPAPTPIPNAYVVAEEHRIGAYTVQLWRNTAPDAWGYDNAVTILAGGQTLAQLDMVFELGELTGQDITGEGNPDVIVERFTGGAHCCFSVVVYDLGAALTRVLESAESNCGGRFEDLDGDSVLEFITCDDLFAYAYCPYAASPLVQVIMQYEPGRGYVPASPRFAHRYAEAIAQHTQLAQTATAEGMGEWDQTTKCSVLPLMLDYLYSGQADLAWTEFDRLYHYPDALLFWAEVAQAVSESSLYTAVGPSPDVPLPSYYMLQWLSHCDPAVQSVGLLVEGQDACDPDTPRRDVYWLDSQLRDIGLLVEEEGLELTPDGCAADCRLDVVRYSDHARLGSIFLDTAMGFPGQVYRANGAESAHWRLRGDLMWEQVSP